MAYPKSNTATTLSVPVSPRLPSVALGCLDILCKLPQLVLGEVPPDPRRRRAEWERVLGLRDGELCPEVCASIARERDRYVAAILSETYKWASGRGGRHGGD